MTTRELESAPKVGSVIRKLAAESVAQSLSALAGVLPHYEATVEAVITKERESLLRIADDLDRRLKALIDRCATAKDSELLVEEMRLLRLHGLQFFRFLHLSRRLLRVASRRLVEQARLNGLNTEAGMLRIELNSAELDRLVDSSNALVGKRATKLKRSQELGLFWRTLLLPFVSKGRERDFRSPGRHYATAMRRMFSSSTKTIYREQALSIGRVLLRIVQPTLIPLAVGFAIVYLIHSGLEIGGIHFVGVGWWAFATIVAAYFSEKVLEGLFERWHLERYRRSCAHTALALYFAEIRARSALLGPIILSEAEPKTSRNT